MTKLSLVAVMASVFAITTGANANVGGSRVEIHGTPYPPQVEVLDVHNPLTEEERQDVMAYIGKPLHEGGMLAMGGMGCGEWNTCATPCCPVYECPCVPVCCPDTHGIFDGGMAKTGCNNTQIWGAKVGCCGCNA